MGKRRIVIYRKHGTMLRLFYSQVGSGMLQFRGKGNGAVTRDSVEIPAQVVGEIHCGLLGLLGVKPAKAVDAHQCIKDEMRPHLQHHDIDALPGDFPLLLGNSLLVAEVLLDLIRQDEAVHDEGGEDVADVEEQYSIDEQIQNQCGRHRRLGDDQAKESFTGQPCAAPNCSCEIEQQNRDYRYRNKWVQRTVVILVFRCDINETVGKQGAHKHEKGDSPQAKNNMKKFT